MLRCADKVWVRVEKGWVATIVAADAADAEAVVLAVGVMQGWAAVVAVRVHSEVAGAA